MLHILIKKKKYFILALFLLSANQMNPALYAMQKKLQKDGGKDDTKKIDEENIQLLEKIITFFIEKYGKEEKKPITKFLERYNDYKTSFNAMEYALTKKDQEILKNIEKKILNQKKLYNKGLNKKVLKSGYKKVKTKGQSKKGTSSKTNAKDNTKKEKKDLIQSEFHEINRKLGKVYEFLPKKIEVRCKVSGDKKKIEIEIEDRGTENKETGIKKIKLKIDIDQELIGLWKSLKQGLRKHIKLEEFNKEPQKSVEEFLKKVGGDREQEKEILLQIAEYMYGIYNNMYPEVQYKELLEDRTDNIYNKEKIYYKNQEDQESNILNYNKKLKEDLKLCNKMIEEYDEKPNPNNISLQGGKQEAINELDKVNQTEIENNASKDSHKQTENSVIKNTEEAENNNNGEEKNITASSILYSSSLGSEPVPSDFDINENEYSTQQAVQIYPENTEKKPLLYTIQDSGKKGPMESLGTKLQGGKNKSTTITGPGAIDENSTTDVYNESTVPLLLEDKATKLKDHLSKKTNRKKNIKHFSTLGIIFIIGSIAVALISLSKKKSKEREENNDHETE